MSRKALLFSYLLGLFYVAIVQLVGEWHPFSRFSMYSRFPDYADYYFLENGNGQIIPIKEHFTLKADEVKDFVNARMGKYNYSYGNRTSKLENFQHVGAEVLPIIISRRKKELRFDTVSLKRMYIYKENETIQQEKQLLNRMVLE